MRKTIGWAGFCAAAMLLLPSSANAERPKLTRALVEAGRVSYVEHCASCHGADGRGNGPVAGTLQASPRCFAKNGFRQGRKPAEVFATLGTGVQGSWMPGFTALPEYERWALTYRVLLFHAAGRSERLAASRTVSMLVSP